MIQGTVKEWVRFVLLSALAAGALTGCSSLEEGGEAKVAPAPVVTRKPAPRELGALWSEDSSWNSVYTASSARVVGDIVTIRLDDAFKNRIARMRGGEEETKKAEEKKEPGAPPVTTPPEEKIATGDISMRATIQEVGTRGVYRIVAQDTLRLGQWEPYIVIKGRVRDRDIAANDEVKVADVVDMNIDLLGSPPGAGDTGRSKSDVSW